MSKKLKSYKLGTKPMINISVLGALTELFGVYYLLANLFGIAGALLWNFGMNTKWTWRYDETK
ncbi:unnamed protein product [marine sediment metagenome]|uniref:GtrA/DPMS transmembrane domain-containing protein n=1 Tax=marine sediment metagenome TaxID=412755 RepID=X1II02_9ZZZZ